MHGSLCLAEMSTGQISILQEKAWDKNSAPNKSAHSEVVTSIISAAFKDAGWPMDSLTHLCVDVGPGSFTGLRVGLNVVRTFGYALNIPIRSFSSLEIVTHQHRQTFKRVLTVLPAIQGHYYIAGFEKTSEGKLRTVLEPQSVSQPELQKAGDQWETVLQPSDPRPLARSMVELLGQGPAAEGLTDWKNVKPLYIRRSEAEEKMRRGLLKPV